MKRRAMPLPRTVTAPILALAAALSLSACDDRPPLDTAPLHGAKIGGAFTLTDQTGEKRRWEDFDGQWRVVYFGFTYCPDICPTDVQRLSQGLAQFEEANPELGAEVTPIFVSVDPERDTPEVVGQFVSNFHPRLVGLTGTPEQIADAAMKFGVSYSRGPETADGAYDVGHSNYTYLFAPDGSPVATLPTDLVADAVAAEVARWVR